MYMQNYEKCFQDAREKGEFITHNAGDISRFRYPHLDRMQNLFLFDPLHEYWKLNAGDEQGEKFASEDITIYEFLSPAAKKIHMMDMLGVKATEDDRSRAFEEVCRLYGSRKDALHFTEHKTVRLADLEPNPDFAYVARLYHEIKDIPLHFLVIRGDEGIFPFGSVLKGTDIVITDGNEFNLGQDLLHALYHIKEGISGIDNDNKNVEEVWADVPALYASQLTEGRMYRRRRTRPSPHVIHFTDYIYLRCYLGQTFSVRKDRNTMVHPAYSVIEPAIRIMFHALRRYSPYDRNRILADAVLCDRVDELAASFDGEFGSGSFERIYGTYSIYDKYELASEYIEKDLLDQIMFGGPSLLPSEVSPETILRIWKGENRYEDISLLSACK